MNIVRRDNLLDTRRRWESSPIANQRLYVEGSQKSGLILKLISRHLPLNAVILEIGSGAGRNLEWLAQAGYKNLYGIEVNPQAADVMRVEFPEAFKTCVLMTGWIEDYVKGFDPNSFDCIYSLTAIQHIPYEHESALRDIARCAKLLITCESEDKENTSSYVYPRDLQYVFEKIGARQLESGELECTEKFSGVYTWRVFDCSEVTK